ncbi:hypothetical protein HPC49_17695 [Pyxidicoccus fallax]|uniref:Uncharacterized protein n=1 Tax=Pyxidicoccus fallax TaxID=394095 RepID=A0A848LJM8_9BACT|nr:hypothetical protein [Pyxidicoccus fallax]NMO17929.1 hypothetical protein [Pyxidicoccus fallax]NPC80046.1 hypothetical protein [Pyxidicoccus fallax]
MKTSAVGTSRRPVSPGRKSKRESKRINGCKQQDSDSGFLLLEVVFPRAKRPFIQVDLLARLEGVDSEPS